MCNVIQSNFSQLLPQIEDDIDKCAFIALDTEFTGLTSCDNTKPSLFDNGAERYSKLRKTVKHITISQLGLSIYVKAGEPLNYQAHTYNFALFPRCFGPVDVRFLCQASSLAFLCNHNFDFNQFVYNGIPTLNQEQEKSLMEHLECEDSFAGMDRDVDEQVLQSWCSRVADWLVGPTEGRAKTDTQDKLTFDIPNTVSEYVLHFEIRHRFPLVWTTSEDSKFTVKKVTTEEREKLEDSARQEQKQRVIEEMLGFTHVFRMLVKQKKPLLGHNCFMDLMLLYDKCCNPLPEKYSQFKAEINRLFPIILDTKHMAQNLRRPLEDTGLFGSTGLGQLYQVMHSSKGRLCSLYSPSISHAPGFDRYKSVHLPHEAGYDAYMCGYVFLRMAHLIATQDIKSQDARPLPFSTYLTAIDGYINCINLIRGATDNICLHQSDPDSRRPQYLVVRSKTRTQPLRLSQLARMFSAHGTVDIQPQSRHQALVAVGNFRCARDLLRAFKKHETISLSRYSMWKHSIVLRRVLWGSVIASGGVFLWTLFSGIKSQPPTDTS